MTKKNADKEVTVPSDEPSDVQSKIDEEEESAAESEAKETKTLVHEK
jgi:hypothetical protein